ncbi:DNA repair ATPase [Psychrobacter sp. AOP7-B1-24]|uniref:DNA repair ATPase n=1 Tax=Psychrobacter sp. AOP7-B1-24 TaxID=3457645 RepID=UPI00402BAE81
MADTQTSKNSDSNDNSNDNNNANQANQTDQAVASGNAYELIKKRLTEQGGRLGQQTQTLNNARLEEFGSTQMQVIARTRIRTEHNCVAQDMVQVGDYLLFGYNVFMGLKRASNIKDVLSLYRLNEPAGNEEEYQLEEVDLKGTFLDQDAFVQDFNELYRYYKQTRLIQITVKDSKLLLAFQIGERITDIRVFRFALDFSQGTPESAQVAYVDNRGERDIELPPAYDFDWIETTRDQMINGKYPHMNILDTIFVETVGGDLTIKIEDNTQSGQGIYSEPVNDRTQSLTDAEIAYAKVGSLILLKILPYREEDYRYFVYNTLTEAVLRLDAIGQSCVQLPEDHGIMFPGGYYLQTGEYKLFEANNVGATDLRFKRKIVSPNGEDVLFLFYDRDLGVTGLFPYNLIKKQLANPIYCNGMALAEDGRLVLFSDQSEPSRIHPMQIWHTPYASHEYVSELPESTSFYGKIGNKELVRGISDLYSITRLIDNQSVSQKLYEELTNNTSRLFDSYYWLSEPELSEVASSIKEVTATAELVIDEFAKVQSIQKQTQTALSDADTQQSEILRQIRVTSFESASDYVDQLSALRRQKGRLVSLEDLRYLDADKLQALQTQLEEAESELAEKTVMFLSGEEALSSYEGILVDVSERLNTAETNAELKPVLEKIDETAQGLDLLTELLGTLDVADATVRTQIIDDISTIYASLNQSKAKLNHKRKNLGSAEAVAQFGAQFKLFGQSIANALSIANTPEKSDEQMAKLLVQLEELESQFADPETNSGDQFLADIISKREEIYETFENHKQQLLDARNRKAQNLGDGALRMLESIKKRTQSTGVTGFTEEEALNTYFAADGLVQKVRNIAKELQAMDFSVKADDIDARLKAIQIESYKSLKDKSDLFEDGGQIIKLGKHRFSVNTQPLDLTLLSRQQSDGNRVLNLHLTGTDYYEVLNNTELNALRPYWDMNIASESDKVYRAEYLAYSIIESAKNSQDGLTEERLYQAYDATIITLDVNGDIDNDSPLSKLVKAYATPRYQLGYDKGIHDHDATLLLMQILPTLREAGLLIYTPQVRALAQLFYWQLNIVQALGLDSLRQFGYDAWLNESVLTRASNWTDRAATAEQLRRALGSDKAKSLLVEDMSQVMRDFVSTYNDDSSDEVVKEPTVETDANISDDHSASIFKLSYVQLACEYLVSVMGQSMQAATPNASTHKIHWQTSQQAQQLCEQLSQTLSASSASMQATASFDQLQSSIGKLGFQPKSAYELLTTWFHALLDKTYGNTDSANAAADGIDEDGELSEEQLAEIAEKEALRKQQLESGRHYVPEAIAVLLTQLNDAQREALVQRLIDSGASFGKGAFNKGQGSKKIDNQGASGTPSALSFSSISSSPVSSTTSLTSINNPLNQVQSFERSTGKVSLEIQVNNLLGEHPRIHQQTLTFAVDDFLNRLHHHDTQVIPAYRRYLAMRSEILHDSKETLRLDEFMPRPLSSFVRNRLINESYLPLIGDNLAKQMGTVGEDKRTDLMGILMMISPPGYGKTTLMEYVANRLGLIFMKINCPSLGHDVTSLDPEKAPNATAREELNKINLAFEMGNNVMLYLDDIQHTHAEFLQKFISLGDGTRRIDGVWQGKTKTYDMRGKKFCVVMAGNPYTESGEAFKVPDMLANRADIYNLGDIMSGMEEVFALSYIENSLTSNTVLAPMANRDLSDVHRLIKMAKADNANLAQAQSSELTYPYSTSEINEIVAILRHMFKVQEVILDVNQAYIASASQDDKYRVEPIFKLQGSYRNMNKMTEKLSAVMNESELNQLIDDHYLGESQLLTQGAESNLLKLGEMRGILSEEETERWEQIKADFLRNKAMGGEDGDTGARIVAQLVDLASGFNAISSQFETYLSKNDPEKIARLREAGQQSQLEAQRESQKILADSVINNAKVVSDSIDSGFEKSVNQLLQIYKHDHKAEGEYLKQNQYAQKQLMVQLVNAVEQLAQKMADSLISNNDNQVNNSQLVESDVPDVQQQTALMATALKDALAPLTMRMDEKLAIDTSTDQSGKLIVNSLNRLNKIFDDYD